ncbi:MAG TPA: hypothetical protein VNH44_19485 [Micropepsaceae bacterium]|nr:hypothetical protein [Micropepsaceae bacterium]
MRTLTKAMFAALALTASSIAISAPANAQVSAYVGIGGDPGYGGYYDSDPYADPYADPYYGAPYDSGYADPYACDYYDPPWGYPPDYCAYQIWQQPIYVGGLWYSGPIYYRSYGGERLFWLNGRWRHDEWRGPRPGRIDWDRNMRWNGPVHRGGDFAGRGRNGGSNFAGRNWNGGGTRGFGNNYAGRNWNGGGTRGGEAFGGREFSRPYTGPNFVAPQNGRQMGGDFRGRVGGGNFQPRDGGGRAFVQPGVAANNGALHGQFGGQAFQARSPRGGGDVGGGFHGGGERGGAGGGHGGGGGGGRGEGHRGR